MSSRKEFTKFIALSVGLASTFLILVMLFNIMMFGEMTIRYVAGSELLVEMPLYFFSFMVLTVMTMDQLVKARFQWERERKLRK